jgi:hypothetical protein
LRRVFVALLAFVLVTVAVSPVAGARPKPNAFNFTMSGSQVVPGPGDPDGTANTNVSLFFSKPYTVCGATNPQNVQRPFTALELHRAPAGEAGPVVALLDPALTGGTEASGCAGVAKKLLQDIQNNPELYYLDAHNAEFPDGAIRGQVG